MVSEVQVDDERLAQELLKEEDRPPGQSSGSLVTGAGQVTGSSQVQRTDQGRFTLDGSWLGRH